MNNRNHRSATPPTPEHAPSLLPRPAGNRPVQLRKSQTDERTVTDRKGQVSIARPARCALLSLRCHRCCRYAATAAAAAAGIALLLLLLLALLMLMLMLMLLLPPPLLLPLLPPLLLPLPLLPPLLLPLPLLLLLLLPPLLPLLSTPQLPCWPVSLRLPVFHPWQPTDTQPCSPRIALEPCMWATSQPHTPAPCLTHSNLPLHSQPSDFYLFILIPCYPYPAAHRCACERSKSPKPRSHGRKRLAAATCRTAGTAGGDAWGRP